MSLTDLVLDEEMDMPGARRRSAVALVLAAGITLAGCGTSGEVELAGRSFASTGSTGLELVDGSTVQLSFEDGRISVNAGCNTLMGPASWTDGRLTVTEPVAMTKMACPEELMAQDQLLASFLASGPTIRQDGDSLRLGDDTRNLTLTEQH